MWHYEWKKLLHHRRGLWLIFAFLLAELLSLLLFTQPFDSVLEENREIYDSYLSQVNGPLTPDKRTFLEAEMERLNQIHSDMEQLKLNYYAGRISEEEYRTNFNALLVDDRLYTGFSELYSQYIFVREQDNRAFLYTGGWEVLLTDQEPDYLFLLLLIVVLTPIFCEEYATRMQEILLTQKHSTRHQVATKICVASMCWIFTQDDGSRMHPDSITDWLNKFSKDHNLPHIHPHAFRHTVASIMIANGVDLVTTANERGHANATTTATIYAHQIAIAQAKAANVRAGIFTSKDAKPSRKRA